MPSILRVLSFYATFHFLNRFVNSFEKFFLLHVLFTKMAALKELDCDRVMEEEWRRSSTKKAS